MMKMISIPAEWQTPTQPFSEEKVEYLVHLKYVRCIARLSKGLSATSSLTPAIGQHELGELQAKLRLAERTMTSLAWEMEAIESDPEYAHACIAWLPAKVYYNLYHFLSLIEYMITSDKQLLRVGHNSCLRQLAERIAGGTIIFSCPLFNTVRDKTIQGFTTRSGEVLSNTISDDRLLSLIMKKIAKDKLHDYQILKGLNLRKKVDRATYSKEENKLKISILDFFYSMRIRTNYKDMSFVDDVSGEQARDYFVEYYEVAMNFFHCFNGFKNDLIALVR